MKNPNGFGSVYKSKEKRRRKWIARKTTGWEEGKQKRIIIGYFETKEEATRALMNYVHNPYAKKTLKEVYEEWSKNHFLKLSQVRITNIQSLYKTHISKIENYYLDELKLQVFQEFFDNLNSSTGTAKGIKAVLNMIFNYAVKNDYIVKNPVSFVELKKHKKVFDKKVFTDDEINKLWDNLKKPFVDSILILIYTGMRVSEMLDLKIDNINLESEPKTIYIDKSKTASGIRYIPISYKILPLITKNLIVNKEYLITLKEEKLNYGKYKYIFKKLMKDLSLDHTIHECRHTTATLLSNAGANPISIAKIMGHTDYNNMTAKVYTHKDSSELNKAMSLLT